MTEPAVSSSADFGARSKTKPEKPVLEAARGGFVPLLTLSRGSHARPGHLIHLNGLPKWLAKVPLVLEGETMVRDIILALEVLGGGTRGILSSMTVPTLMSH
jgi:hypothetical protein